MKIKGAVGIMVALGLVLFLGTNATAELAKKGTYKGNFAWNSTGKVFDLEKGHQMFVGEFTGGFTNDDGKGFMHITSWVCPGVNDLVDSVTQYARGYCVVTDLDGDKAYFSWKGGKETKPGASKGTFQWTGGTGKYTGITGENTYDSMTVLPTTQGYSHCEGAWQLP